jgi:hypothetical protein
LAFMAKAVLHFITKQYSAAVGRGSATSTTELAKCQVQRREGDGLLAPGIPRVTPCSSASYMAKAVKLILSQDKIKQPSGAAAPRAQLF